MPFKITCSIGAGCVSKRADWWRRERWFIMIINLRPGTCVKSDSHSEPYCKTVCRPLSAISITKLCTILFRIMSRLKREGRRRGEGGCYWDANGIVTRVRLPGCLLWRHLVVMDDYGFLHASFISTSISSQKHAAQDEATQWEIRHQSSFLPKIILCSYVA